MRFSAWGSLRHVSQIITHLNLRAGLFGNRLLLQIGERKRHRWSGKKSSGASRRGCWGDHSPPSGYSSWRDIGYSRKRVKLCNQE